jgi:hypothetical protein
MIDRYKMLIDRCYFPLQLEKRRREENATGGGSETMSKMKYTVTRNCNFEKQKERISQADAWYGCKIAKLILSVATFILKFR